MVTLTPKASVRPPWPTAPIATGWSDSCRVGFAPTGTPCLSTAHENCGLGWQNRSLRGERREWIERATEPQVGMFVPEIPVGALDERALVLGRGPQVLHSSTAP